MRAILQGRKLTGSMPCIATPSAASLGVSVRRPSREPIESASTRLDATLCGPCQRFQDRSGSAVVSENIKQQVNMMLHAVDVCGQPCECPAGVGKQFDSVATEDRASAQIFRESHRVGKGGTDLR